MVYAKRTLEAGFTAIRNVGAEGGADISLRKAIDDGLVTGPRIWTARQGLSITGGHGDQGGLVPALGVASTWMNGIVDSPEEAAKAVRYQHKYGADLIKFTATGGVLSIGDSGTAQQFSEAEMRSIVETAHLLGIKVAAHAHGKHGMEAAIRAGVDSIEHGTMLDDETIALFKKHGRISCRRCSRDRPWPTWRRFPAISIRRCRPRRPISGRACSTWRDAPTRAA